MQGGAPPTTRLGSQPPLNPRYGDGPHAPLLSRMGGLPDQFTVRAHSTVGEYNPMVGGMNVNHPGSEKLRERQLVETPARFSLAQFNNRLTLARRKSGFLDHGGLPTRGSPATAN